MSAAHPAPSDENPMFQAPLGDYDRRVEALDQLPLDQLPDRKQAIESIRQEVLRDWTSDQTRQDLLQVLQSNFNRQDRLETALGEVDELAAGRPLELQQRMIDRRQMLAAFRQEEIRVSRGVHAR